MQVRSPDDLDMDRRLLGLLQGFDDLEQAFKHTARLLARRLNEAEFSAWCDTVRDLLEGNFGAPIVRAYLALAERWPSERPLGDLVGIGKALRVIGRETGSTAVQALLDGLPRIFLRVRQPLDLAKVLADLERLAKAAPESVVLVARRLESIFTKVDTAGFEAWLLSGIRACGTSVARRRAYFGLDDPLSTRLLMPGGAGRDFARLEKRLTLGFNALWNRQPPLRVFNAGQGQPTPRRISLIGGLVRFPASFAGVRDAQADLLYRAAAAHAGAHFVYSTEQFPLGKLKPLQVAIVSLIEDARVEALALRELPGLSRLWIPFHNARSAGHATAPVLMARLSRALLDLAHEDSDQWVVKGRNLFQAAQDRLSDPGLSREIGGPLGNDIGQMRLQFDARSYVVEPAYRDDNMALWDFGDQPDAPVDEINVETTSVRREQREDDNGHRREDNTGSDQTQRVRSRQSTDIDGLAVASYPEWDYILGRERSGWTTIVESEASIGDRANVAQALVDSNVAREVAALARAASIGRRRRDKRQHEGDVIDLDACIAAVIDRRMGLMPDTRIFQQDVAGPRDLSFLLLMDLSQSTADVDRGGRSILSVEREAATIMTAAVEAAGDSLAVHGFSSDGRERVRYQRLKDFNEPFDDVVRARLAALSSHHSTRLGAAIRHAGRYLADRRAFRRVLLVLTDGEPSDIDIQDPHYLTEDARRAVLALRKEGIDVFAFGLGGGSFRELDRIAGVHRTLRVPRIETLPLQVMQLYSHLKK